MKILTGSEATKGAVQGARLTYYKRIHFATHTIFDEQAPERTGIILTPSDTDDGISPARDVLQVRLDADLVVLASCESGVGKFVRGEGIAGLSQAFPVRWRFQSGCE